MPSSTSGFTGTEIVSRVVEFIGNTKDTFRTYVEQTLPLAEYRYCKAHDWSFLHKQNLSLTVVSGTNTYALSPTNLGGYTMNAKDVETIFDPAVGKAGVLDEKTVKELRRLDPEVDDGGATQRIRFWAPVNKTDLMVWPPNFETTTLKVDGKISPTPLLTLSNYPTIPFENQEAFIEYVIAVALKHENDDRFAEQRDYVIGLIREDIADDMKNLGGTSDPRIRSMGEAAVDGVGGADSAWISYLFR